MQTNKVPLCPISREQRQENTRLMLWIAGVFLLSSCLALQAASPVGTAFTYQGRLAVAGSAATGTYDLRFIAYDAPVGGSQQGGTLTTNGVVLSQGIFTAGLDFGNIFDGTARWLEVAVRTNGASEFSILSPRQKLAPTPYALQAAAASAALSYTGPVADTQLSGNIVRLNTSPSFAGTLTAQGLAGNGSAITNLNASHLSTGLVPDARLAYNILRTNQAWLIGGNSGTSSGANFLGTTDSQPLVIKAGGGVGIGGSPQDAVLDVEGSMHLNNYDLFLRSGVDRDHGIGYYGTAGASKLFAGLNVDGPVVYGYAHGALGTSKPTQRVALTWHNSGNVGVGTSDPQGSLHVFSTNNPTVLRLQSSGAPGFGRIEFASNPQGDANEWRPGFIQSLDLGGFTGGLMFCLNGSGAENRFGTNEILRLAGGRVGINQTNPASALDVNGTITGQGLTLKQSGQAVASVSGGSRDGSVLSLGTTYPFHDEYVDLATINFASLGSTRGFIKYRAGDGPFRLDFMTVNVAGEMSLDISRFGLGICTNLQIGFGSTHRIDVLGGAYCSGTQWVNSCDRNAKENFEEVNSCLVLEQLAALPISTWNYKSEDARVRHAGPTAQDFRAAFGLGENDTSIGTVDEAGIALAAIQGLNQKVEAENAALRAELRAKSAAIESLQDRLLALENQLSRLGTRESAR